MKTSHRESMFTLVVGYTLKAVVATFGAFLWMESRMPSVSWIRLPVPRTIGELETEHSYS